MSAIDIFAYGSNLSVLRLRARVPSARFIGRARLDGHRLRFHKRSVDGSAKADCFPSGGTGDCVWGAVFTCPLDEKPALDRAEHVGNGYDESIVRVEMDDRSIQSVMAYIADPAHLDPSLLPYTWYHRYVLTGAMEQKLPRRYVEALRSHPACQDPDPEREALNALPGLDLVEALHEGLV